MYLHSFSHFRAVAILLIVAGHSYGLAGWRIDSTGERVLASVITGATALFVFISGFFFYYAFYRKFDYRSFTRKKLAAVYMPYMVCTTASVLYYVYFLDKPPYKNELFNGQAGIWNEHLWPYFQYLWYGAANGPYWYVPFIIITFLLSPLHVRYIESRLGWQIAWLSLSLLAAMLIQRPLYNLSVLQSLIYFSPYYLLGILVSIHADELKRRLSGKEAWLLAAVIGFALLEAVCQQRYGNYHKPAFDAGMLDLMTPQKVALCLLVYVYLRRFDAVPSRVFGLIAEASFAIFFIHPWIIDLTGRTLRSFGIMFQEGWLLPVVVAYATAMSIGVAMVLKRLLGKTSQSITGW